MRHPFPSYSQAIKALAIARRILPDRHWYITNEFGGWDVVEA